jgi:hypothetical protein
MRHVLLFCLFFFVLNVHGQAPWPRSQLYFIIENKTSSPAHIYFHKCYKARSGVLFCPPSLLTTSPDIQQEYSHKVIIEFQQSKALHMSETPNVITIGKKYEYEAVNIYETFPIFFSAAIKDDQCHEMGLKPVIIYEGDWDKLHDRSVIPLTSSLESYSKFFNFIFSTFGTSFPNRFGSWYETLKRYEPSAKLLFPRHIEATIQINVNSTDIHPCVYKASSTILKEHRFTLPKK